MSNPLEYIFKRIIEIVGEATSSTLTDNDYAVVDSGDNGTRKTKLSALATWIHNKWAAFINALTDKTSFANGDKIPVVNGSTATAMEASTLLELTAQNALAGNVAPVFVPNDTETIAGRPYVYGDKVYVAKESGYQGVFSSEKFDRIDVAGLFDLLDRKLKSETFQVTKTFTAGVNVPALSNIIFENLRVGEVYELTYSLDSGSTSMPYTQGLYVINASGSSILGDITGYTTSTNTYMQSINIPLRFVVTADIPKLGAYVSGSNITTDATIKYTLKRVGSISDLQTKVSSLEIKIEPIVSETRTFMATRKAGVNVSAPYGIIFKGLKAGLEYELSITINAGTMAAVWNQQLLVVAANGSSNLGTLSAYSDTDYPYITSLKPSIRFSVTTDIPFLATYINGAFITADATFTYTLKRFGSLEKDEEKIESLEDSVDAVNDRLNIELVPETAAKSELVFSGGKVSKENFYDSSNNLIREDSYTYSTDEIVQTISVGGNIVKTITFNLNTKETTYAD